MGLLREKENPYLSSFFLDPEDIKIKVWGPSGTLGRNRAPVSWYQIMGHKVPVYRAWVDRDRLGSNPNANQSINQPPRQEKLQTTMRRRY
jgi:hypothetical protein